MTVDNDAIRERLDEMRAMATRLSRRLRTSRSLLRELEACIDQIAELLDGGEADEPGRRRRARRRD